MTDTTQAPEAWGGDAAEAAHNATDMALIRAAGFHAALGIVVLETDAFNNPSPLAAAVRQLVDAIGEELEKLRDLHSAEYQHLCCARRAIVREEAGA